MNVASDFISAHLAWIKSHPAYAGFDFPSHLSYYELQRVTYDNLLRSYEQRPEIYTRYLPQDIAKEMFMKDLQKHKAHTIIAADLAKELGLVKTNNDYLFITIGFNHQTFNVPLFKKWIEKFIQLSWIDTFKGKFELYRENGEHPHIHMIIKTDKIYSKSQLIQKIWKSSKIKEIVLKESFIDYKICEPRHFQYIDGNKTDSKLPFVQKDIEFRKNNNIPEFYTK